MANSYEPDDIVFLRKQGFHISGFFVIAGVNHYSPGKGQSTTLYKLKEHPSNPGHEMKNYVFLHEDLVRCRKAASPKYEPGQQVTHVDNPYEVWTIDSVETGPLHTWYNLVQILPYKETTAQEEELILIKTPETYPTSARDIANLLYKEP